MKAVLFSGGVDSLVHLRWAMDQYGVARVRAVYFDVGQVYARRESERAAALADRCGVRFDLLAPMRLQEDPDTAQVEFRNAFLILWAATLLDYCDGVVFGMLQGEAPPDKTPRFVRGLQRIIRDCRAETIYGEARPFTIHVPFARYTKAEMLRWYRRRYADEWYLQSVGCFAAEEPMCGHCWSCFNRWLAWQENGLALEPYATHPADAMLERLRAMRRNTGRREWRALAVSRLWARRRWLRECHRQLGQHARARTGQSAWSHVFGRA